MLPSIPEWAPIVTINHDAARRVATVFEKWIFLIETYLRVRRENSLRRLNLYGTFAAFSLLEYGGLKPILLPFLGGRSDAACRVVILPFAIPYDAYDGVDDGLCSDVARRVAPQTRIAFNNCCVAINTAASRLGHRGGAFVASRPPFAPPPIASCGFLSV